MSLSISGDDLADLPSQVRRAFKDAHRMMALELWGNIRENSPVDHGRLAGSWDLTTTGLESKVSTNVVYALFQEEGTHPYDIYPSSASALQFQIGGKVIYAKSVHHPGVEGKRYVEQSITETNNRADDLVSVALGREGLI